MDLSTPDHLAIADHLLTTTRSVRQRLDFTRPVEPEIIERCIEIAIQAPTGSNRQGWHFVVVTEPAQRAAIAGYYRQAFYAYLQAGRPGRISEHAPNPEQMMRVARSSIYLAEHMAEAPALIIPCIEGRVEGLPAWAQASIFGSILPAAWSLMLALRSRGIGAAWTSLHLMYEKDVAQILGLPDYITQTALLPVAYFKGEDFQPADRIPARFVTHWDGWNRRRPEEALAQLVTPS